MDGMMSHTTSARGELDPVAESVAVYSDHADDYAAVHAPKMADRAERFAGSLPTPSLILDAGCGPGRDLARFRAYGHVVRGVDLNPVFVAKANTYAPTSQCDLREIGTRFPAGTFDGVWASASLVHLDAAETVDVLGQFGTLLRPGGKLYVCLKATGHTGWLDESEGRRWYTVWDPDEFAAAVRGASFEVDRVDRGPYVEVWASRNG
ncbi:class I SAM-dependent methyltransferase [Streptomyces sp. GS7]|uniref:class I SAM-dependent methyltransferase n=1 Tax=Streptomyces sp. GS7 TaxID=2692234 RepID=UPI001318D6DA|nr:class I SAM-dependent methyltransferase [Streptomyces sp. GS7]QHC23308.1 methyltransferase domain-containing protein [Streptomyces sp. GS7]